MRNVKLIYFFFSIFLVLSYSSRTYKPYKLTRCVTEKDNYGKAQQINYENIVDVKISKFIEINNSTIKKCKKLN
tara:strand:+ start:10330 stop:10551 length:222 start_codon:yes stop_codon:yes gene_type:complete